MCLIHVATLWRLTGLRYVVSHLFIFLPNRRKRERGEEPAQPAQARTGLGWGRAGTVPSRNWAMLEPGRARTGPIWNRAKPELGHAGTRPSQNWTHLEPCLAGSELSHNQMSWNQAELELGQAGTRPS